MHVKVEEYTFRGPVMVELHPSHFSAAAPAQRSKYDSVSVLILAFVSL